MAGAVELGSVSTGIRAMFLMLTPNESSFEKVEDVPQYVQQVGTASVSLTQQCVMIYCGEIKRPPLPSSSSLHKTPQVTFTVI